MTILLAGDWHSNVHERPMAGALTRLGHTVVPFEWDVYVRSARGAARLARRAQNKYLVGPLLRRINADLVREARRVQPDVLFVYRGTHVTASALREIRSASPRTYLVGYNNDDAFAEAQARWPWRHFIAAVPEYDRVYAYRTRNIDDLRRAGARSTGLLLPWYVPSIHYRRELTSEERRMFGCDVVFVGHYEPDGRLECLAALADAGVRLKIFGPDRGYRGHDWNQPLQSHASLRQFVPTSEVWNDDYAKALSGARIALCFFSKRNRDVYTRRCFEIPATGALLMSEYSPELAAMFRPGAEADYFTSPADLVDRVQRYLRDEPARARVAESGCLRAAADGHDVDSRMRVLIDDLMSNGAERRPAV